MEHAPELYADLEPDCISVDHLAAAAAAYLRERNERRKQRRARMRDHRRIVVVEQVGMRRCAVDQRSAQGIGLSFHADHRSDAALLLQELQLGDDARTLLAGAEQAHREGIEDRALDQPDGGNG
jgi:hypothetical protein